MSNNRLSGAIEKYGNFAALFRMAAVDVLRDTCFCRLPVMLLPPVAGMPYIAVPEPLWFLTLSGVIFASFMQGMVIFRQADMSERKSIE